MSIEPAPSWGAAEPVRLTESPGLAAFASEAEGPPTTEAAPGAPSIITASQQHKRRVARLFQLTAILLLGGSVAAGGTWQYKRRTAPASSAFLSVESSVPGLEVTVADNVVGRTPVAVWLQPGTYAVRVGQGAQQREMKVNLAAGASVFRHLEVSAAEASAGEAAAGPAQLRIETEPSAMTVTIDGVARGTSPVAVQGLAAGTHDVVVRGDGRTLRNTITLRSGEKTVLLFASSAKPRVTGSTAAAPAGGWLAVKSAIPVQIREGGKVVGTSDLDLLMLPAGEHALEFVNESLGYQSRRTVRIDAGKTASVQLEPVNGVLSINAQPWAEVWLNGDRLGETPIGNLSRPIGTYEVVLRHPQLGERRERVTITAREPARLGVDLRKGKS